MHLTAIDKGSIASTGTVAVTLRVNGVPHPASRRAADDPGRDVSRPSWPDRNEIACNRGACSACTVWLDGGPVCSCMILAFDIGDRDITTVEGLAHGDRCIRCKPPSSNTTPCNVASARPGW